MAHAADLLAHVEADLVGCRLERTGTGVAVVTPPSGAPFRLAVRDDRRRLLHLQTLLVHVDGHEVASGTAATAAVAGARQEATVPGGRLAFHHTGQVRRTGLTAVVRRPGRWSRRLAPASPALTTMREQLVADGELEAASITLDFTRLEVEVVDRRWRATLELMGGSHVRTTLPPSSRYVRLHPDQCEALLATVAVLQRRLPGTSASAPVRSVVAGSPRGTGHLPRRAG
jgi:hypothetical protein